MKKSYKNMFDKQRRDFLKVLASAGITKQILRASPLLWGVLHSRIADAQTGPNKLMIVYVPDGCIPSRWLPPNTTNLSGTTMPVMSAPYNANRNNLNFLRNLSHHNGGHGAMPMVLNNDWNLDSFDVNIGKTVGADRPFQFVNLGAMTLSLSLTRNAGSLVLPETSPYNAFRRLFSGSSSSSTSGAANPRQAIVDTHKDAITALKNKLANYEQQRLDSHLTAINAFQARLGTSSSGSSSSGACNAGTGPSQYPLVGAEFSRQCQDFANIAALALSCNLTASVSLCLGEDGGMWTMPYLNYQENYHASIHGTAGLDFLPYNETRGHLSSLSNNVVSQLSSRGVLNSTIFMETTDMGHGNDHSSSDIPLILGGGGGRIRVNRSADGNSGFNTLNLLATAGVALNANQHAAYRFGTSVISGVIV